MTAWFTRNGVAANLLMAVIVITGLMVAPSLPLEVFPEFEVEQVQIVVPFPGATPTEVEQGVTIKIEEAIFDLEGIETINSVAGEGSGTVTVDIDDGYDTRELLDEIKARVDAITTFPVDAERPVISQPTFKGDVIDVVIYGELPERELRRMGEMLRDELTALPGITQVQLDGVREYELSIEVSERTLQEYGLTLAEVAAAVRRSSLDLSAGQLRTNAGDILIRTEGQAYTAADFARIVVRAEDNFRLTLGDIASIKDGFAEQPIRSRFNGQPAVSVGVYRVGDQSAIALADIVKEYIRTKQPDLPQGLTLTYWRDGSQTVKNRLSTLLRSAVQGGILILVLLSLFLKWSVAIWVFIGIPVAFLGGLAVMPLFGGTINIIALFGFIVVLGIVVDDAIVTGENIYRHLKEGGDPTEAAIRGNHEVLMPVTIGVLTTIVAFIPMLEIEGYRGKIFAVIPMVVIPVLLFSLVESKLILPAHLKHVRIPKKGEGNALVRGQRRIADGLETVIERIYQPMLGAAMRYRYATVALFVGVMLIVFAVVTSGNLRFVFFPRIESEFASATLTMPPGTPFAVTDRHIARMTEVMQEMQQEYRDEVTGEPLIEGIFTLSGTTRGEAASSNVGRVYVQMMAPEQRNSEFSSRALTQEWRQRIGPIPGAKELTFRAEIGRGGSPIDVRLIGEDFDELRAVGEQVKDRLGTYPGVFDVTDSFESGKEQITLELKPQAELLGLTLEDLARQVRQAYFGFEVQRIQRGRDEVRVYVRYPLAERASIESLEQMRIRTPMGAEVPFAEVAEARFGRSFSKITRIDRYRVVEVLADVDKKNADIEAIKSDLGGYLDDLMRGHPGVRFSLEGEAREQRDSLGSLQKGTLLILFIIYCLLAIPFKSYVQPLAVLVVIPFGIVGAVGGHLLMGYSLSIVSILGMVALIGVVVNDSLVLVDYINQQRTRGLPLMEAVRTAGVRRFRAVMLTSLTTFAGLTPLLFEKSTQAQFLKPMAISLGFGVLFATLVTLFLVPMNYLLIEDARSALRWIWTGRRTPPPDDPTQSTSVSPAQS